MLLNLLHRTLRVQRRHKHAMCVHAGRMRNGLALVLGVPGKTQGFGSVEGNGVTGLARGVCVCANERGFFGGLGLGGFGVGFACGFVKMEAPWTRIDGLTLGSGSLALRALGGGHCVWRLERHC